MELSVTTRARPTTRTIALGAAAILVGAVPLIVLSGGSALAAGNTRNVSTTGHDSGTCISSPCATINYALSQAAPGDTVKVAAGTYNQQVKVEKPISLVGAGAGKTIIDGRGLDTQPVPAYGVIFVGTTGGSVTVTGFTITNPFPYAYTGGEPEIVALADTASNDVVTITKNTISEGTADTNAGTDFPIGIDTFNNAAQTVISNNTVTGTFQGALLEDNGPATVRGNTFAGLNASTDTVSNTVYPAEGVFFLSDLSGALTGQNATSNTFKSYAGFGIAMDAGYNNGNCSTAPCNGSISGTLTSNSFALNGASGASGIALKSEFAGNDLTATVTGNHGYVTSPSNAMTEQAEGGGTLLVTEAGNSLSVQSGTATPMAGAAVAQNDGGLHSPK